MKDSVDMCLEAVVVLKYFICYFRHCKVMLEAQLTKPWQILQVFSIELQTPRYKFVCVCGGRSPTKGSVGGDVKLAVRGVHW